MDALTEEQFIAGNDAKSYFGRILFKLGFDGRINGIEHPFGDPNELGQDGRAIVSNHAAVGAIDYSGRAFGKRGESL